MDSSQLLFIDVRPINHTRDARRYLWGKLWLILEIEINTPSAELAVY